MKTAVIAPFIENNEVIAFKKGNALWIPWIYAEKRPMKEIVGELVDQTGLTTIHFTSLISKRLLEKLHNFTVEKHWFKQAGCWSYCAKVKWERKE